MKLLSIAIPCYNSQDYMEHCIRTLLVGGEDVEILIVDDGSKDATPEIADSYAKRYPTIIRAVHQENGGHGSAVNAGIRHATGLYYKVVDSDDWVDEKAFLQVLEKLRELAGGDETVDLFIAYFVYDKVGVKHKKVMRYTSMFPVGQTFGWNDVKLITKGHYLLMHSVIYRTEMLRKCKLELPKHTFYVDNIYVYHPLPYVKKMYYMDVDLYHYYIGREDQSVNEEVMIGRIDQQIKVNKIMVEDYALCASVCASTCSTIWRSSRSYLPCCCCVRAQRKIWRKRGNCGNISNTMISACSTTSGMALWATQ